MQAFVIFRNDDGSFKKVLKEYDDHYEQVYYANNEVVGKPITLRKYSKTSSATLYNLDTRLYSIFDIETTIDMPSKMTSAERSERGISDKTIIESLRYEQDMFNALPISSKEKLELITALTGVKGDAIKTQSKTNSKCLSNKWMMCT